MNYILETERLRLREFTLGDTSFILELVNSPGWLQFIGDRNIRTAERAETYLQNGPISSYKVHGFGLSLVEEKESGKPVGMCGMIRRADLTEPDIGFAFLPAFTGLGYAFEMADATMRYAKEQLGLSEVVAITVPENERSIKLLEKLGMRYVKTFCFPGKEEELLLYSNEAALKPAM